MIEKLRALYRLHGTKVLGWLLTVSSILTGLSTQILGVLPPESHPWFNLFTAALGLFVVKRGYTNSKTAA